MLPRLLPHADEIVIARGDLGNDLPLWELPAVQKEVAALCRQAGIQPEEVVRAVLTGNTAMLYFLCGEEVSSIAAAPFASRLLWGDWQEAASLELPLAPSTPCYLPRCISAYVGADITTAILAAGYPRLSGGAGWFCPVRPG